MQSVVTSARLQTRPRRWCLAPARRRLPACWLLLGLPWVLSGVHPVRGQSAQAALDAASPKQEATNASSKQHLAPHDTFYLLEYVSAKTATGVVGFEPGQEVHLVAVHPATRTLLVTDGKAQVEVGPDKLTNDQDIAAMVRQKDQANQSKVVAYVQAQQQAYDEAQRSAAVSTAKDIDKINQQQRAASTVSSADSSLNQPAVAVAGSYGSVGSATYGSPYSYFSGGTAVTGSAAATSAAPATAPATTGTAGR